MAQTSATQNAVGIAISRLTALLEHVYRGKVTIHCNTQGWVVGGAMLLHILIQNVRFPNLKQNGSGDFHSNSVTERAAATSRVMNSAPSASGQPSGGKGVH